METIFKKTETTWPYVRLLKLLIVLLILVVLLGKLLRYDDPNLFFFGYGIAVTFVIWMTFFVALRYYKDPYEAAIESGNARKGTPYFVSCMVAVRNEEENISRCLDSMLRQTYAHREVIVVNDASTDRTLDILRAYERDGKIILINLKENVGKKKALAKAMARAKGEIFAHTDSDSVWSPTALAHVVRVFESDPDVGAVGGHGRALNAEKNILTQAQDAWMEGQHSIRKAFESVFDAVTCVSGPLAVFRREAVYNYIPAWKYDRFLGQEFMFATDRTMTGFVLGSASVGERLKKKYARSPFVRSVDYPTREWKVVYCKSAKNWTIVPDTLSKFLRQQIRWKKSFIRNMFFTGSFFWKKPFPVALVYYLHILFVFMGPFVAFRHLVYLPMSGNLMSAVLYISGIAFIGFMFGMAYKIEERSGYRWIFRPIMSLLSTLVVSWLVYYSVLTIRKMIWTRN